METRQNLKLTSRALIVEMASLRIVVAALCAAWADSACREPHPALPYYHPARESPKLAVLGMYYHDLPASHVPTADQFKAILHGPAIEAAFEPVCKSNLQPDFNVCVFDRLNTRSSAVLRELEESNRSVQKSAKTTSICPS